MGTISQVAASNTVAGSGSSVATNLPTGIQTGDIVLLFVSSLAAITTPTGFTQLNGTGAVGAQTYRFFVYSKTTVTNADSGAALTISFGGAVNYAFSFLVLRASGPLGYRLSSVSLSSAADVTTNPYTLPSVTPTRAGAMVIHAMAALNAPATSSSYVITPAGYTVTSGASLADYRVLVFRSASPTTAGVASAPSVQLPFIGTNSMVGMSFVVIDRQDEHTMTEGVSSVDTQFANIPLQLVDQVEEADISDLARRDVGASVGDTVLLLDSPATQLYYRPTMAEAGRIVDRAAVGQVLRLAEVVAVADQTFRYPSVRLTDTVRFQPVVQPNLQFGVSLTERGRVIDALRRVMGGDISLGIGISEATARAWRLARTAADTANVADALSSKLVLRISVAERGAVGDATAKTATYRPTLQDEVEIAAAYIQPGDTFATWVMNVRSGAVTEYENFDFNSFAQIAPGRYAAANREGIFELSGETDAGDPIAARIKSGLMQFAGSRFIGLKGVYLGVRASGDFYLKLETGDGQTYTYLTRVENMETTKVHVGKGLRTRYLSFELSNKDGQDFDLDTVEFVPMWAQRRV